MATTRAVVDASRLKRKSHRHLKVRVEHADAARVQVVHDALEQRGHHLGDGAHGSGGH
jgi:hypothetical protein